MSNRYTKNWMEASKNLRTGKKKESPFGKKKMTAKEKQAQNRRRGFLMGVIRELMKNK